MRNRVHSGLSFLVTAVISLFILPVFVFSLSSAAAAKNRIDRNAPACLNEGKHLQKTIDVEKRNAGKPTRAPGLFEI